MDASSQARDRLGFLDAGRAVAALMVVVCHACCTYVPGYLPWALTHLEVGRVGVVLFLLISGFIIPSSLEQGGHQGKFWLRRFFRLFPAYWLAIVACYLALLVAPSLPMPVPRERTADWLLNLTMCQGFFRRPHVVGVFWTLQLELVIYVTCSLLFALGLSRRVGWWVGVVAVAAFLPAGLIRPLFVGKPHFLSDCKYLYFLPLMGLIARRYWAGEIGPRRFYALVAAQPCVLAGVWLFSKILYPAEVEFTGLRVWVLDWGLAYLLFLGLLEARRLPMPGWLLWIGRVSYSIYLFHPLVLGALLPFGLPGWAWIPIVFAATLAVSALSYYGVEEPGIALGRLIERRLFAPKQSATAAASGAAPPAKAA